MIDDIKLCLPKYLSAESYNQLIKDVLSNGERPGCYYLQTRFPLCTILQGDGLRKMPYIYVDKQRKISQKDINCMVFSNTCDIDQNNDRRKYSPQIMYAPITNLKKYEDGLIRNNGGRSNESIQGHLDSIRKQRVSSQASKTGQIRDSNRLKSYKKQQITKI